MPRPNSVLSGQLTTNT